MNQMFAGELNGLTLFNQDIGNWDVSNVTDMREMFYFATSFNQDIGNWDVSNVTTMYNMFWAALSFNQNLSTWDLSSVTTVGEMFKYANELSDGNKCLMHLSFQIYDAWPYDWSGECSFYVPDDNFEQALIDLGYDDTLDDTVSFSNIIGVTNLEVGDEGISDLTGIEAFTSLTSLDCRFNNLTSLDVTSNVGLTYIDFSSNQLTSIDLSNNCLLYTSPSPRDS